MPRELDTPRDVEDIYLARGEEVQAWRPIMTGDVFTGVQIPGVDDTEENLAMITTHPCSMRGRHGQLKTRVSMARVDVEAPFSLASWPTMFPKRMPLPELKGEGEPTFYLGDLEEVGRVPTADLMERLRVEGGEFDRLLSEPNTDDAGRTYTLRDDLREPPRRPSVRRAVHDAIKERIDELALASFVPDDAVSAVSEEG